LSQAAAAGGDKANPSKRKRAADSDDDLGSDSEDEFYDRTGAPSKKAATAATGASGGGKKAGAVKGQPAAQVESAESLHAKRWVGVSGRGRGVSYKETCPPRPQWHRSPREITHIAGESVHMKVPI
jgi:hypothetical protein